MAFKMMTGQHLLPLIKQEIHSRVILHRTFILGLRFFSTKSDVKREELTLRSDVDGIRTITLNNPKKRNALSLSMLESLKADLTHDVNSRDLRVIILRANGPVFSSGHDLKELRSDTGMDYHTKVFDACTEVMNLVQDIPVPVIAEVQGLATAAGCQLVATCDMAFASEKSTFATPGVMNGLFCSTPGVAVARAVPRKIALQMLFTGQPISAQDAVLHGLINKVVPEDQLRAEVMRVAERICEMSQPVIAIGKRLFYRQVILSRDSAYKEAGQTMVDNLRLRDTQEGIKAFFEKRSPVWRHGDDKEH